LDRRVLQFIPETAQLAGMIRTLDAHVRAMAATRMRALSEAFATRYGADITVELRDVFSVLDNAPAQAKAAADAAQDLLGAEQVGSSIVPLMGSEDFADMMMAVPGAYVWLGARAGAGLHNAGYDFDDAIIPVGSVSCQHGGTARCGLRGTSNHNRVLACVLPCQPGCLPFRYLRSL
jgi:metal-dependent amidase/aminoacylase/carboxypeptidase family protein